MSFGLRTRIFTGKKLFDYITHDYDYLNAGRIINGLDRVELIQGYAQAFEQALTKADPRLRSPISASST